MYTEHNSFRCSYAGETFYIKTQIQGEHVIFIFVASMLQISRYSVLVLIGLGRLSIQLCHIHLNVRQLFFIFIFASVSLSCNYGVVNVHWRAHTIDYDAMWNENWDILIYAPTCVLRCAVCVCCMTILITNFHTWKKLITSYIVHVRRTIWQPQNSSNN